jgi:hypothetical protein
LGKLKDPKAGSKSAKWPDKTTLACGVTRDMEEDWKPWGEVTQDPNGGGIAGGGASLAPAPVKTPPWAEKNA